MSTTGTERNERSNVSNNDILRAEVARQTVTEIIDEVKKTTQKAADLKKFIEESLRQEQKLPQSYDSDIKDTERKNKSLDVKKTVQKLLLASATSDKIPIAPNKSPEEIKLSSAVLKELSKRIMPDEVTEHTAPYLHQFLEGPVYAEIPTIDTLVQNLKKISTLQYVMPDMYRRIQESCVKAAMETSTISEIEAQKKFGLRAAEDGRQMENGGVFNDETWNHTYGSYFTNADRPFVESLYSPSKFIEFSNQLKKQFAVKLGKSAESREVKIAVSKDIERRVVELFGKLYTRLDHEKPSEFFHEIEQQDVMRGILPVKNELKRRMALLATELDRAEKEGKIDDPGFYQSVESRPDIMDVPMGDEKRVKPRFRLIPFTHPEHVHASHFVHYLDQLADHYIEARKYTHNARAIFLHPVDHEKGFYGQLAHFAEELTTVDFDQLMALPDNEIFRDAFSLYDKYVEEAFASNDWRHSPTMFELKQNSLHTQIEEDVLEKLKVMYGHEIDESRLEAALSMAVGASRGMFLNEIEKAAFADPHLSETGGSTFASYYNQDASALIAFNPMHHFYRWQAPNTFDPILFMPVEGFKGDQILTDHRVLWEKMQAYKDSFVHGRGRGGIEGETLFADFIVNIGKVGGPLQRKGWRTTYMLEPLYYYNQSESKEKLYVDNIKTWKRLENIGYEAAQDFVVKMGANPTQIEFLGAYERKGWPNETAQNKRLVEEKKELFSYLYTKYFGDDPSGLDSFMKGLRKQAEVSVWNSIKHGKISPSDVQAQIEIETSNLFLYSTLARIIAQRIPSKILRIDRDRYSKDGVSRWRKIAQDMNLSTQQFDEVMKDLLMGEQMLRKSVSAQMKSLTEQGKESWSHGSVEYNLTEKRLGELLRGKLPEDRVKKACDLLRRIKNTYMTKEFLDGTLAKYLKSGEYKFSFALDETDMSFIPFRGAGSRVLARAVGDISAVEKNVAGELTKFPKLLQQIAVDGKHDVTPILDTMTKIYGALDGIIGTDYAHRVVHHLAAMTINYFKKDTSARILGGVFGFGRKNSLAAERAGRSSAVWEWDSRQIDNFCVALETRALLPKQPYSPTNSKPEYTPVYINLPFVSKPVKLPQKLNIFGKELKLFSKRKPDFEWSIKNLRDKYGGNIKDIMFDILNTYLPLIMFLILMKYMKDAYKESEGKKK